MAKTTITKILMRRGSDHDRKPTVLDEGEPGWTTDTCRMYVGDGRRDGGVPIVNIRTAQNAPVHMFNTDLIYEPINDVTGTTQPPTQEVLAINHPGLSASVTREWMDDRYVLRDPCATNSRANPADPVICAPGSTLLPKQIIKAHVDIMGDLIVHGHSTFKKGIVVHGEADFCDAVIKAKQIISCDPNVSSKIDIGDNIDIVTKGYTLSATTGVSIDTDGDANITTGGDVTITGDRTEVIGDSITIPTGDTSSRPVPAKTGDMRFNTTLGKFEGYDRNTWGSVGGDTKTFYVNGADVREATDDNGLATADPTRYIFVDPILQSIGIKAATQSEPVYLIKITHDMNQMFNQVTVFDDYRQMVLPDDIHMADQNTCYINIASFLVLSSPGVWELPSTGPGPIISTWAPPDGNPPADKKWSIMVQA